MNYISRQLFHAMNCQSSEFESIEDSLDLYFKTAVSRETKKNNFPWDSVSCYLKNHKEVVLSLANANLFCDFFINVLENHVCEESAVFSGIIDVMTVLLLEREARNLSDPYYEFFRSKRGYHLELSTFYLREKIKNSVFPDRECIEVVNALKTGNHRLMQVLATYGYYLKISDDSFFARKVASAMIKKFMNIWDLRDRRLLEYSLFRCVYGRVLQIPEQDSATENDTELLNVKPNLRDLVYLSLNPLWQPETARFKRLFLLILGIHALWLRLQNNPESINFVECLDIVFKTISEPYITMIEVRSLLINYVKNINGVYLLDEWCTVFEDTMPFCVANYEPRRLCHLARCQVRENLCKSKSTLPSALDQMEIPNKIKDFLLCKPSEKKLQCF